MFLQPENVTDDVTMVVYMCLPAVNLRNHNHKSKKVSKAKKTCQRKINAEENLRSRIRVQLVPRRQIEMYVEFDRNVTKVEGNGTKYLQDLKKSI